MAVQSTLNGGVAIITKADNTPISLSFNANSDTTTEAVLNAGSYGTDITGLDASKLAAKANLTISVNGETNNQLTTIIGGKGADTIIANNVSAVVTGNAGKDLFVTTSDTSKAAVLTVTDYTSGQDSIQAAAAPTSYTLSGKDVTLNFGTSGAGAILKNAKDKLVTIVNSAGTIISEQSFQIGQSQEYDITNANTGSILTSGADYIDGSGRSKPITINLSGKNEEEAAKDQTLDGAKGNDTIVASPNGRGATYYVSGGKGNDTFIINSETNVVISDYTKGGKEKIQMGANVSFQSYETNGDDVVLNFYATNAQDTSVATSKVTIVGGKWDQISAAKKSTIVIAAADGSTVTPTGALADPHIRYVTKVNKKDNAFDLEEATVLGYAEFTVNSSTYEGVTFVPGGVSVVAGGGYETISGGKGKDTIIGDSEDVSELDSVPVTTPGAVTKSDKVQGLEVGGQTSSTNSTNSDLSDYTFEFTLTLRYGKTLRLGVFVDGSTGTITKVYNLDKESEVLNSSNNFKGQLANHTFDFSSAVGGTYSFVSTDASAVNQIKNTIGTFIQNDVTYTYVYNPSYVTLAGGGGNDLIYTNITGGVAFGEDGNDTLRGGQGSAQFTGGKGNDVFLLTGEASGGTTILDYNSGTATQAEVADTTNGKKSNAARKKELGADKITVAWDKYNAKNTAYSARAEITGSSLTQPDSEGYGYLNINVQGNNWIPGYVDTVRGTSGAETHGTVVGHFYGDGTTSYLSTDGNFYTNREDDYNYEGGVYSIKLKEGDLVTVVEKGITYSQYVNFGTNASEAKVGTTFTQNYNGLLNEEVKLIDAATSKKNSRLVAGEATASVLGGTKNDTLVGNGKAILQGAAGNDIYIVNSGSELAIGDGDTIIDYSEKNVGSTKNGKDKVQVTDLRGFTSTAGVNTTTTVASAVWSADDSAFNVTFANADSYQVKIENGVVISVSVTPTNNHYSYTYSIKKGQTIDLEGDYGLSANATRVANAFGTISYVDDSAENLNRTDNAYSATNKKLTIGGITFQNYEAGTAITFQQIDEVPTYNAKKGIYTGSKNVTQTMIRGFGKDSVVSAGASTYIETFAGDIDSGVTTIKAGSKALEIKNRADNVSVISGSAKVDTIDAGYNENVAITVTSGKGNDIIKWDGLSNLYITDFTSTKYNKQGTKMTAGDIILLDGGLKESDITTEWDVNDVILKNTSDGVTYSVTLKNAKGQALSIASDTAAVAAIAGGEAATVSATNPHEIILGAKDTFAQSMVNLDGASVTTIVNASAANAKTAQNINLRTAEGITGYANNRVGTVYGGKGADTVYAGSALQLVDLGAGNDLIYTGKGSTYTTVITGVGNDVIVLESDTKTVNLTDYTTTTDKLFLGENVKIASAAITGGSVVPILNKKGVQTGTTIYSDVTISLSSISGGAAANAGTVNLTNFVAGNKITRISGDDPGAKSLLYYSLDYVTVGQTTIDSKDYSKGAIINLEGVASSDVVIAKTAKNVAITGGANAGGTTIKVSAADDTSKNAITFYGSNSAAGYYEGAAGADIYYGNGAADTVVLGAGNDTVRRGDSTVAASVVSGVGNNVFVADGTSNYTVSAFSTTDKIALATVEGSVVDSVVYTSDTATTGSLKITYKTPAGENSTDTGYITLTNYTAGQNVSIAQIGVKNGKETAPTDVLVRGYGAATLKLNDASSANIELSSAFDANTTAVDASDRKKAVSITGIETVNTLIGGAGADTITAVGTAEKTITTGAGKDVIVISAGQNITITDYAKDDVISVTQPEGGLFTNLVDYDKRVSFSDDNKDVILKDGTTTITLKDAVGTAVSVRTGTETKAVTYSDPVNVVLTSKSTALDWTATENNPYDSSRVLSFNASATTKSQATKFTAEASGFTKFTGGKGEDAFGDTRTGTVKDLSVDMGAGGGTVTLSSTNGSKDTIAFSGGTVKVDNFNNTDDKISGVTTADIKSGAYAEGTMTLTLKKGSLAISGNAFTISYDNFKATTNKLGGETDQSDTTTFTYDKIVTINGIGSYAYKNAETTGHYATADAAKNSSSENYSPAFEERFSDFEELVGDYVPAEAGLSDITAAKADISESDFKTSTAETDYTAKLAANSALTTNKKQE